MFPVFLFAGIVVDAGAMVLTFLVDGDVEDVDLIVDLVVDVFLGF
jgi:hypothetical protein